MRNQAKIELESKQKQKENHNISSRLINIAKNIDSKTNSVSMSNFAYNPAEMSKTLRVKRAEQLLYLQRISMLK